MPKSYILGLTLILPKGKLAEVHGRNIMRSPAAIFVTCGSLIILCLSSGCMNRNADSINGTQYFELTPTQVNENRRMANEGDAEAAFRLYQHYAFGVADEGTGAHWLKKAADLGSKKAKQHLDVEAATEKSRKADSCTGAPTKDPFE